MVPYATLRLRLFPHLRWGFANYSISNQQLADICGISISYFIKQFRQLYHMTPQEYIMHRRICKGRDLLIQTAIPIDTISDLLGFCNPSHFIRRFQQAEGMSPTQYRSAYRIV